MPSYKTHSIHGEVLLDELDSRIPIDVEDIKTFCIGPDSLISTDYKLFDYQHSNNTREYFETMLKLIKENNLQDNSEVMAFLYGQLDHFILDVVTHPLIYYMTENFPKNYKINPHGLVEMWIDDYMSLKYDKDDNSYYKKDSLCDDELKLLINELYSKVYGSSFESSKYDKGIKFTIAFDTLVRGNKSIIPIILKLLNIGDIKHSYELDRVLPFLNLNHHSWRNPETNQKNFTSFDDLWNKSLEESLETISDVNHYLYDDKQINNPYIINNTSYNTGFNCEEGQKLKYLKRYKFRKSNK